MIANRTTFGGGGGGGGNRAVVFTIGVREDGRTKQTLDAFARRIEEIRRMAANIPLGASGAAPAAGGGTVARTGVARGVSEGTAQNRQRARALDALDRETEWWARKNAQDERRLNQERERSRRAEERYQSSEAKFWDRAVREEKRGKPVGQTGSTRGGRGGQPATGGDGYIVGRSQFSEALEGLFQIGRAVAFLSATSKESAEEMIRTLARFEAAAFAIRGTLKLSEPLGSVLGMGAAKLGMRAGAGATGLGIAGVAAGVGILGGGMAIADQIRYSRTGQVGGFSTGVSNFYAGIYRKQFDWGMGSMGDLEAMQSRMPNNPYLGKAIGDIKFEQGLISRRQDLGGQLRYNQGQLGPAQNRLYELERGYGTKQQVAEAYTSLDPFNQRLIRRMRDRWLDNPSSLNDRQLAMIKPWFGAQEQGQISKQQVDRTPIYDRGFAKEGGIKFDDLKLQRELTLKLTVENEGLIRQIDDLTRQALREASDDFNRKFDKMNEDLQRDLQRIMQNAQNSQRATVNAYGTP